VRLRSVATSDELTLSQPRPRSEAGHSGVVTPTVFRQHNSPAITTYITVAAAVGMFSTRKAVTPSICR
jgi:hypothetical protein